VNATATRAGDLARRVRHRREELGLTEEEVARRSGMIPGYLRYLEQSNAASLTSGSLLRLATALETTPGFLRGGSVERPPGPGRAGPHPHLDVLSTEQCLAHLAGGGVGRFVFLDEHGPAAFPVNFRLLDGDVVFRTRAAGPLAAAADTVVGFEVDRVDDAMSEGWSVLVTGRARRVDDAAELARVDELGLEPWPGGSRRTVVRVGTDSISGRSIRQREPRPGARSG
jgi:nitroimidazol reductase NimA-like FMN-containing flavoprotein (pyridoxamine 5'-phosphate oxidase superfamily)